MTGFTHFLCNTALALVMSLPLLVGATPCPPQCECSAEGDGIVSYTCKGEGATFVMKAVINTRAEIYCQGTNLSCANFPSIQVTHSGLLPSLTLDSCRLPRSLSCVTERLGARAVGTVRVESCSELVGEHLDGVEGIRALWIRDSESQTTIPFDAIAAIPTLIDVRIHNTQTQLTPPAAHNTQLQRLEMIQCGLKDLPRGVFRSFGNLKELLLCGNEIKNITERVFEGLDNLDYLDLSNNPLGRLSDRALSGAARLREVQITQTDLEVVGDAFEGLDALEKIDISSGNKPLTFQDLSLSNLTGLKTILINSNPLLPLPKNWIKGSRNIETISITNSGIVDLPGDIFKDQIELKTLILTGNTIEVLPEKLFWTLISLETLDLSENRIEVLPEAIFDGLSSVKTITIDNNRLHTIPHSTFNGPKNLLKLSLKDNKLTLLENDTVGVQNVSPFSDLVNLEEIDLSENRISVIFDDWRVTWIHSIKWINLSNNRIVSLRAQDVEFHGINVTVDLQYNKITTINVGPSLIEREYDGATFILDFNPIDCSCRLHPFLNYTRNHKTPKFSIANTQCASPLRLTNETIQDLKLEDLTCDLVGCPETCTCTKCPQTSTLELDCLENPGFGIPNPANFNLTRSKLRIRRLESLSYLPDHVLSVNLQNLSLTDVPHIPKTVLDLDLRYNHLKSIPEEILRPNLALHLAGNKIKCDCWNKKQIVMLRRYNNSIRDYNDLTCDGFEGTYLKNVDMQHICDVWWATIVGCSLAAAGLLAVVTAGIAYYYIREILKYIYKQGWPLPPGVYEDEIDNKQFDVLISYSDSYEKFAVSRLVPLLRGAGYSVCVRCVEWDIGDFLPNKIPELVEKSRRVVVLLSDDYFESEARLELKSALINERRGKRKKILLVVTQDLGSNPALEQFLKRRRNLELHDASFWETLKRKLPKKRKEMKAKSNQRILNQLRMEQKMLFTSKMSLSKL